MDARGIVLKVTKINIVRLIDKIADFYTSSTLGLKIKIIKKIKKTQIDNFYTDPEKLEQIINNLMSNAIKFVDKEDNIISVELIDKKNSILIKISDNGIGIKKNKLKSIFNRFEQGDGGQNSFYTGTGIGLAFAKQLLDYMKGKIWAESEGIGKGSTFTIELKKGKEHFDIELIDETSNYKENIKKTEIENLIKFELDNKYHDNEAISILSNHDKEKKLDPEKAVILIVDDDKTIAELILKYLKNHNYSNFILAFNGKQGLDMVYKYSPDIIICDFNMPYMRGDQFQDELTNNPQYNKIPFIFLSAYTDNNIIIERKQKGACAYLYKPINEKELILTVNQNIKKYFDYLKILQIANIDELTGINNRRNILKILKKELFIRKYIDLSIIMIDIDYFKNINDKYGHQAGDKILSSIGKLLKTNLREYDSSGRYGGEEFLLVLPHTSIKHAVIVAEGLRKKIKKNIIDFQGEKIKLTASFGVSSLIDNSSYIINKLKIKNLKKIYDVKDPKNSDWKKIENYKIKIMNLLIKMADISLYRAKNKTCKNCGFTSEFSNIFNKNICPECSSNNIEKGRDKVIFFSDK